MRYQTPRGSRASTLYQTRFIARIVVKLMRNTVRRATDAMRTSETVGPIILAVSIGASAGLAAIFFRRVIELAEHLFQDGLGAYTSGWFGPGYLIPIIALGGLLVGLITKYFAPETKGHGVPEVMLAVAQDGGRIRARVTIFKIIAAALCIGSGGSAGREGPIVQIGSAMGSVVGRWFRLPDRRVILSVACGAAGGVAATFNAPMAGVIFALEVILARFTAMSFGLVVMSSATATVVAQSLSEEGDNPAFDVLTDFRLCGVDDLLCFIGLGILCALVAQLYTRVLYLIEDFSDDVKIPNFLKPAIGGALVGVLAIWCPKVIGTGYESITDVLNNEGMLMRTMFILCFAKIVATSLSVGSGGSGGIFAPALFIGAMFGGGYGTLMNNLFPESLSSPGAYALIGMAAVFSGAAHAPITSIFILFEMTDSYHIIIPLMSATVVCTFVSQYLSQESIYTLKLCRRGIHIGHGHDTNMMDAITVAEAMEHHVDSVPPDMPLTALIDKLYAEHETGCCVVDNGGRLIGMVSIHDVEDALFDHEDAAPLTVKEVCTTNVIACRPEQTLNVALHQFGARNFTRLPVIAPHDPECVIGVLTRLNIVEAYAEASRRDKAATAKAGTMQSLLNQTDMVVEKAMVNFGSQLADTLVGDAGFPADTVLGAIRRGHETIVPSGSTRIYPGDQLVVLTLLKHAAFVKQWLKEKT